MTQTLIAAFSEDHAERLTGVRKLQLRYWDKTGFFSPSFSQGQYRDTFGRVYSFRDIVALRVLASLRNEHKVSVQHLRQVKQKFAKGDQESWIGVRLYVVNKRVHWIEPDSGLPQDIASGQYTFIDLDSVIAATEEQIKELNTRNPKKVGKIEKIRTLNHSAPVIAGTRIPVQAIKRFHEAGYDVNAIRQEYPDLSPADVKAALAYKAA